MQNSTLNLAVVHLVGISQSSAKSNNLVSAIKITCYIIRYTLKKNVISQSKCHCLHSAAKGKTLLNIIMTETNMKNMHDQMIKYMTLYMYMYLHEPCRRQKSSNVTRQNPPAPIPTKPPCTDCVQISEPTVSPSIITVTLLPWTIANIKQMQSPRSWQLQDQYHAYMVSSSNTTQSLNASSQADYKELYTCIAKKSILPYSYTQSQIKVDLQATTIPN